MTELLNFRVGPLPVVPTCIVVALLAADVTWVARMHRHLLAERPSSQPAYSAGFAVGLWFRTVVVVAAGVYALTGSAVGFVLFAAGTIWRAMAPGRAAVAGFLTGYEESSGRSNPALAAAFGAAWVAVTRGIPLALLYASTRAA